jgi:hypothetical protein
MKKSLLLVALLCFRFLAIADEGMWIPLFLKQLNESDMKARGMKISAEDIYSVNKSSMKDAVVLFGGGCTGEIISSQGLLLTNHHCGFSQIQSHSSVEKNYLKNGFWAYTQQEELACPGLSVTFIIRIDDVTGEINSKLTPGMSETERDTKIKEISTRLEKAATEGNHYTASVRSFYNGNQFFLMLMETFKDVRMVGAPPSSIGKFGGDTDNWMWPRHTGDFALFRVYAGKDNKPAEYSEDNVPFTPRYSFPVSIKGVEPGDFTMVFGFPGRTSQYIPSFAVKNILEVNNPARIKIRTARLEIIDEAMRSSEKLRLQYAAKQASIANAWKKWQGESRGLKRLRTIEEKQAYEAKFNTWCQQNNKKEYASIVSDYEKTYKQLAPLSYVQDYINEAAMGVELLRYALAFNKLSSVSETKPADETAITKEADRMMKGAGGFFRDYDMATDKKLFVSMMQLYVNDVDKKYHPKVLTDALSKYKGNISKWADEVYSKSSLTDSLRVTQLLTSYSSKTVKKLQQDPAFMLAMSFRKVFTDMIEDEISQLNGKLSVLNRLYMAAQMEMEPNRKFYPDANSTLRVAFGQVNGYEPRDAVKYLHYTTLQGILEKEDPDVEEFEVPQKLKELYHSKDFGPYAVNGQLPVAFVASNHTTGGNSGSPVLNANGELIGTNFDRVWEGTMSDIDFDPAQCRNISLDIRYTLFIIDKFAGCKRLIDEMKIVK